MKFIVNLDNPPEKRWSQIISTYRTRISSAITEAEAVFGNNSYLISIAIRLFDSLTSCGGIMYSKEIEAIAHDLGLSIGKVALSSAVHFVLR